MLQPRHATAMLCVCSYSGPRQQPCRMWGGAGCGGRHTGWHRHESWPLLGGCSGRHMGALQSCHKSWGGCSGRHMGARAIWGSLWGKTGSAADQTSIRQHTSIRQQPIDPAVQQTRPRSGGSPVTPPRQCRQANRQRRPRGCSCKRMVSTPVSWSRELCVHHALVP